jgi:hypothetical protein
VGGSYLAGYYFFPDTWKVRRRLREFNEPEQSHPTTSLFKTDHNFNLDANLSQPQIILPPLSGGGLWKG